MVVLAHGGLVHWSPGGLAQQEAVAGPSAGQMPSASAAVLIHLFVTPSIIPSFTQSFIQHGLAGAPLGGAGGMRCHETDTVPAPGQDPASFWGPDNKKWHILQGQAVIVCEGERQRKARRGDFLF